MTPYYISITPDGKKAYVTNNNSSGSPGSVSVINTATNVVIETVIVGNNPFYFAITPDGSKVYVANNVNNPGSVSVIDTASNEILITITTEIGNYPYYIAITPDGTMAYVANNDSSNISVIDIATNDVTTIPVGSKPRYIAITPAPRPPALLSGRQEGNIFLTQTDLVNVLKWQTPPSGPAITRYRVYRNAELTDLAGVVENISGVIWKLFQDHHRRKNIVYSYYVVSQDVDGTFSSISSVTVKP